jgi:DNA-binding response OmpR family regulator
MAYKLLIADNSRSAQKAIQMAFSELDYEIHTYFDGNKLLEDLKQVNPDVLVLGLSLAGKDGYEITHFLNRREKYESLPLILLQDAFAPVKQERCKDLKYSAIFLKPFDSEELARQIRVMVGEMSDPDTLPEELELDETQDMPIRAEEDMSDLKLHWEEVIRQQVKKEMVGLERELEKRIAARIRAEIKVEQAYAEDDSLSSDPKEESADD